MAKPLIAVEVIYAQARLALDAEGADALHIRRLAADLGISTRTLYQQVGSREQLIRTLVARHFSQLRVEFRAHDQWTDTAWHWCVTLRDALRAHPFLTELMTIEDRQVIEDYVIELVKAGLREGIPRSLAIEGCRALVSVTVNQVVVEVSAQRDVARYPGGVSDLDKVAETYLTTIRWILAGIKADTGATSTDCQEV